MDELPKTYADVVQTATADANVERYVDRCTYSARVTAEDRIVQVLDCGCEDQQRWSGPTLLNGDEHHTRGCPTHGRADVALRKVDSTEDVELHVIYVLNGPTRSSLVGPHGPIHEGRYEFAIHQMRDRNGPAARRR